MKRSNSGTLRRDWTTASKIATDILKACLDCPNCTAFNNWGSLKRSCYNPKPRKDATLG